MADTDEFFDRLDAALAARPAGPRPGATATSTPDAAVDVPTMDRVAEAPGLVSEALIEEVTRRVVERLGPAMARDVVAQVVSQVAERLVKEEIARIRNQHV